MTKYAVLLVGLVAVSSPAYAQRSGFPATGERLLEVLDVPEQYTTKRMSAERASTTIAVHGYIWGVFQSMLITQTACFSTTTPDLESPDEVFATVRDYLKRYANSPHIKNRTPDLVVAAIRESYPCRN